MGSVRQALSVGLCVVTLLAARPSRADDSDDVDAEPRPPSGVPFLVPGWILFGLGLVEVPLGYLFCQVTSGYPPPFRSNTGLCDGIVVGTGASMVVVSVPLIAVGTSQRRTFLKWREEHLPIVKHVSLIPEHSGLALGWHTEF